MLDGLKRLFGAGSKASSLDLGEVADWAKRRGHSFRRARDDSGFVIEGLLDGRPWRLEWGPPQRSYIGGRELRIRMEIGLASDAQLLLLTKPLMEALERQTFEEFTESTQTQIGTSSPEEMRWLVMFPRIDLGARPALKAHFGAVASQAVTGQAWLDGPLANALERASTALLAGDPPFVLMVLRNRGYLRVQLAEPDTHAVAAALELFEISVTRAQLAVVANLDASTGWGTTAAAAWQAIQPEDTPDRRG